MGHLCHVCWVIGTYLRWVTAIKLRHRCDWQFKWQSQSKHHFHISSLLPEKQLRRSNPLAYRIWSSVWIISMWHSAVQVRDIGYTDQERLVPWLLSPLNSTVVILYLWPPMFVVCVCVFCGFFFVVFFCDQNWLICSIVFCYRTQQMSSVDLGVVFVIPVF